MEVAHLVIDHSNRHFMLKGTTTQDARATHNSFHVLILHYAHACISVAILALLAPFFLFLHFLGDRHLSVP